MHQLWGVCMTGWHLNDPNDTYETLQLCSLWRIRASLDTLVMRGVQVDWDVLQEFLTYWGFIHSLIPPNHFNTRVPKLGLRRTTATSFARDHICSGSVSELRMSKSAIIPCRDNQHLFAYGDESLYGVRTWRLPSFQRYTDLKPHRQPVLDLRYAESSTGERYLGCLSAEKLQVFTIR